MQSPLRSKFFFKITVCVQEWLSDTTNEIERYRGDSFPKPVFWTQIWTELLASLEAKFSGLLRENCNRSGATRLSLCELAPTDWEKRAFMMVKKKETSYKMNNIEETLTEAMPARVRKASFERRRKRCSFLTPNIVFGHKQAFSILRVTAT